MPVGDTWHVVQSGSVCVILCVCVSVMCVCVSVCACVFVFFGQCGLMFVDRRFKRLDLDPTIPWDLPICVVSSRLSHCLQGRSQGFPLASFRVSFSS